MSPTKPATTLPTALLTPITGISTFAFCCERGAVCVDRDSTLYLGRYTYGMYRPANNKHFLHSFIPHTPPNRFLMRNLPMTSICLNVVRHVGVNIVLSSPILMLNLGFILWCPFFSNNTFLHCPSCMYLHFSRFWKKTQHRLWFSRLPHYMWAENNKQTDPEWKRRMRARILRSSSASSTWGWASEPPERSDWKTPHWTRARSAWTCDCSLSPLRPSRPRLPPATCLSQGTLSSMTYQCTDKHDKDRHGWFQQKIHLILQFPQKAAALISQTNV